MPREKHAFFVFVPFQTPFLYYYLFWLSGKILGSFFSFIVFCIFAL